MSREAVDGDAVVVLALRLTVEVGSFTLELVTVTAFLLGHMPFAARGLFFFHASRFFGGLRRRFDATTSIFCVPSVGLRVMVGVKRLAGFPNGKD
jgi:hypothetical protein